MVFEVWWLSDVARVKSAMVGEEPSNPKTAICDDPMEQPSSSNIYLCYRASKHLVARRHARSDHGIDGRPGLAWLLNADELLSQRADRTISGVLGRYAGRSDLRSTLSRRSLRFRSRT